MKNKATVYTLTTCSLMTALMCILGPYSIPIGPVPISFTNLIIYLSAFLLGAKKCTVSCLIYLLMGMIGLPVFSGYEGGFSKLAGPTGGYLVGFLFLAFISGIFVEKSRGRLWLACIGMGLGTLLAYGLGTVWFAFQMNITWTQAMTIGVLPFLPFDLIKIIVAALLGKALRQALSRAQLL